MSELPRLHTAKEVADALGCSEWFVKERARRREIPSTLVGRGRKFTAEQFTQILAIFEQDPVAAQEQSPAARRRSARTRSQPSSQTAEPVTRLQARQPQRRPKAG